MNDRDTFAAAALTGLIANGDYSVESTPLLAYRMADTMLRERGKAFPDDRKMECPQPTLTNEEREAIEAVIIGGCEMADTLRKLLERLS